MGSQELPLRQAVALGAIQGPAELLPISSSGHLAIIPRLLGWDYARLDPELRKSFEVAVHAGTALALLVGLRGEVAEYARGFGPRNAITLALSFTPTALIAYRYERVIEQRLGEPVPVALGLIGGSIAMLLADGRPQRRGRTEATAVDALVIGAAQAFALAPGVSRNGATLTAARWRGFKRADANVISRQIALPVIVGASILKGFRLARRRPSGDMVAGMAAGTAAAFASTLASMRLISTLERSRSLRPYALYRLGLAAVALAGAGRQLATTQAQASKQAVEDMSTAGAIQ
ncbi:MAG: undecaprenyl-diphosphate phosphatase [Phycisphaeraceae bacterium]